MKYAPPARKKTAPGVGTGRGRARSPETWKSGPSLYRHDCYYAYLKHRCQARYRSETYELTMEEWFDIWDEESFNQRGRSVDSICLSKKDYKGPWRRDNVQLISRLEHLRRQRANAKSRI